MADLKEKKKKDDLAAKLRGLDERLVKVERVLRGLFSADDGETIGSMDEKGE